MAGIASAFAALAHKKIKPGGVLALVLPLSVANGLSWQGFRKMLDDAYTEVTVLSISANGREMSFSSDTGMAECLVIARRLKQGELLDDRLRFTSLSQRPQGFAHARLLAGELLAGTEIRRIEDGPYGGTPLMVGQEFAGETITALRSQGRRALVRGAPVRLLPGPNCLRPCPSPGYGFQGWNHPQS